MKLDPYNHKERYFEWKKEVLEKGMKEVSKANAQIIFKYIQDMEYGLNVSLASKKGARSYHRLNTLREKMKFFSRHFKENFSLECITDVTEDELVIFFAKMRNGEILTQKGKAFKDTGYYVRTFKAFWHWWQVINRKQGNEITDITLYLDGTSKKAKWVYLTEEQVKLICKKAKGYYKTLIMFLYDTGIRSPTELMNVKVSDFSPDFKKLNIRAETSKTMGRNINLMFSSNLISDFIKEHELNENDFVFTRKPATVNKYLKRLSLRLFGDKVSPAGEKYSNLTMYDFRHCSCCYWQPKYKQERALMYRFGWKDSKRIEYYTEFLGMGDTITEEDILGETTKTELERDLDKAEQEKALLIEEMEIMKKQMNEILEQVKISQSNQRRLFEGLRRRGIEIQGVEL